MSKFKVSLVKCLAGRMFADLTTTPPQLGVMDRPFVVIMTTTAKNQITNEQLTHLTDLPDNATDSEWAKFYRDHDGDVETALSNFRSFLTGEVEVSTETVPEPEPKTRSRSTKQTKA